MRRSRTRAPWTSGCILVLGAGLAGLPASARAGDPPPVPTAPTAPAAPIAPAAPDAFSAFLAGQRAFEGGDFLAAAQAFESAYRLSPHPDVLWNAARAWDHAGEIARAANRYERYLREAPAGARDRDSALQALKGLAAKLGRVDVIAPGFVEITVDDEALEGGRVYVTPGAHVVRGRAGDRRLSKTATVNAGETVSVALVDDPAPEAAKPPAPPMVIVLPAAPSLPAPAAPRPLLVGWQRVVVGAGLAATAISGGVLTWSGVDTLRARAAFDGTPQALEDGRAKQARTNVLIATTAGLGALSLGAGVVFARLGGGRIEARAAVAVDAAGAPRPWLALRGEP